MHLNLDVQQLRAAMALWRHVLEIRETPDVETRREALTALTGNLSGWTAMLRACSAQGAAVRELEQLRAELREFKEWADQANQALRILTEH